MSDALNWIYQAVLLGGAVGYLRWGQTQNAKEISQIKKALGLENGSPGAFVRRTEWELARSEYLRRLTSIEDRIE